MVTMPQIIRWKASRLRYAVINDEAMIVSDECVTHADDKPTLIMSLSGLGPARDEHKAEADRLLNNLPEIQQHLDRYRDEDDDYQWVVVDDCIADLPAVALD